MNDDRVPNYPDAPDYLEDLRRRYDALRFPDPNFRIQEAPAAPAAAPTSSNAGIFWAGVVGVLIRPYPEGID